MVNVGKPAGGIYLIRLIIVVVVLRDITYCPLSQSGVHCFRWRCRRKSS